MFGGGFFFKVFRLKAIASLLLCLLFPKASSLNGVLS